MEMSKERLTAFTDAVLGSRGMFDVVIKVMELILTLTVFPSAMMWAVLLTAIFIVLPRSI